MGTRTDRLREAQRHLDHAGQPLTRATEHEVRETRPSAWRWSRGADIFALLLLIGLLGIGGAAFKAGVRILGWISLAAAAILVVVLVIHAATAGRRFGMP